MPLPAYRELEIPLSLTRVKDCLEPLLYTLEFVRDDEEIVGLEVLSTSLSDPVMFKVKIKKHQPVTVIEHN